MTRREEDRAGTPTEQCRFCKEPISLYDSPVFFPDNSCAHRDCAANAAPITTNGMKDLLAQRDELLAACREAEKALLYSSFSDVRHCIKAAIARCEKGGVK